MISVLHFTDGSISRCFVSLCAVSRILLNCLPSNPSLLLILNLYHRLLCETDSVHIACCAVACVMPQHLCSFQWCSATWCGHFIVDVYVFLCGVSVKSMAILESDKHLRLLIASSDGYIKLYDVFVEVCSLQRAPWFFLFLLMLSVCHLIFRITQLSYCLKILQVFKIIYDKVLQTMGNCGPKLRK